MTATITIQWRKERDCNSPAVYAGRIPLDWDDDSDEAWESRLKSDDGGDSHPRFTLTENVRRGHDFAKSDYLWTAWDSLSMTSFRAVDLDSAKKWCAERVA